MAKAFNSLGKELSLTSNADTGLRPTGRYSGDNPVTVSQAHPPVRYRNLESPDSTISEVALDGYYYFTVEMGGDSDRAERELPGPGAARRRRGRPGVGRAGVRRGGGRRVSEPADTPEQDRPPRLGDADLDRRSLSPRGRWSPVGCCSSLLVAGRDLRRASAPAVAGG